ncbi:NAD(P)H-dependent flavin oxidoreductase [Nocardia pseudovaccinii]|uniref:NAD(P)H-dependent flavin oxidoreductase n=1 Tax=Nocardia pseudovaccinii TaxID=189540 RepID=UPI0007A3D153|nr:nitronate monooxygenase [Nocardia pseudovaccinii]
MDVLDRLRLDVPVAQAGMAGVAGGRLAAAVASAGGLGTIGLLPATDLRAAIGRVRDEAPGRSVAVNLLMRFARRRHVQTCIEAGVDVVVVAFGGDAALVRELRGAGVFVLVMVGTENQARAAVAWGADGLIAQGREAGGHLVGTVAALDFLPRALAVAQDRPVFLAGGVATSGDTGAALAAGAAGVVAGTRFVLTEESGAHREYQRRILAARMTLETTLFGLSWPMRHRVVPNTVTDRWCRADGAARRLPALINSLSAPLARLVPEKSEGTALRMQRPAIPLFSPAAPLEGMPGQWVDRAALYAGESVLRINGVVSAKQAVAELAG